MEDAFSFSYYTMENGTKPALQELLEIREEYTHN
jgi:hypothetical protein